LIDAALVPTKRKNLKAKVYEVPATRIAEELGQK